MSGLLERLLATPAWLTLLVVFALPALESSAFLGFVFPGELAVLLGGVAASRGHFPLVAVLAAGICGAIAGDAVGYLTGRLWGRRILDSTLGRFVRAERLDRAERVLARRGAWAIVLGRFTVAFRVLIPGLAGMARMPYSRFALANVSGGVTWVLVVANTGYLAGTGWHRVAHVISGVGAGITLAGLALLVIGRAIRRRRTGRDAGRTVTGPEDANRGSTPRTALRWSR